MLSDPGPALGRVVAGPRQGAAAMGAAMATSVTAWLTVYLVGTLALPMRTALHFTPEALGWAVAASYAGAALTSVALSGLVERLGGIVAMRLACAVTGLLLLAMAVLVDSWAGLVIVLALAGVSSAFSFVATNLFLARRAPEASRGAAFGFQQASVPLATAIAGVAVPALGLTLGWRFAFVAAALIAFAVSAALPRRRSNTSPPGPGPARGERARVPLRPLLLLTVGLALGVGAANALTAFLVSAAVAGGLGLAIAGLLATLGGVSAAGVRIGVGVLADRRGGTSMAVVAAMLGLGGGGYALLAAGDAGRVAALLVAGTVLAFAAGWGWNGLFYLVVVSAHIERPARATAITQTGGRAGGALGPLVFGFLVQHGSYPMAWVVTAGMAVVGAVVIALGGSDRLAPDLRLTVPVPGDP